MSNAGAVEVNGTYVYAKKTQGIPEYWFIKQIEMKKKTIEHIFKIRGNVSLPQMGDEFEHCWTVQRADKDNMPIQYYAAPMKSLNEKVPPRSGWVAIGGIDPTPVINDPIEAKEMENIKLSYQATQDKVMWRVVLCGKKKNNKKKNTNFKEVSCEISQFFVFFCFCLFSPILARRLLR